MKHDKTLYIRALKTEAREGRRFRDLFLVMRKHLATSAAGKPYLKLTLGDSSDTIDAFLWDGAAESDRRFAEGDVIEAAGSFKLYQGTPQLTLESVSRLYDEDLEGLDAGQFLPASRRSRPEMWAELRDILWQMRNPSLLALVDAFCSDNRFVEAFQAAPAATGFHHAFVGGLLEHTLGVVRLARDVGSLYAERLNADVLLTGAFLHDVGKVEELTARAGFDYTDAGRLVGHIVLGAEMVRRRAAQIPVFPEALLLQVEHLILSHHGEREWGAPIVPQTLEALLLHYLDNIDAKLGGAWEWMERERAGGGRWTTYWKGLGRQLFLQPLAGPGFGHETKPPPPAQESIEEHFLREEREARGAAGLQAEPERPKGRRGPAGQGSLGF